jgi:hypothetical protein
MGLIQATPQELLGTGGEIAALGPTITTLSCLAGGFQAAGEPQQTADALQHLGQIWSTAATRLDQDIVALGRAVQASGIAYEVSDRSSMVAAPAHPGPAGP